MLESYAKARVVIQSSVLKLFSYYALLPSTTKKDSIKFLGTIRGYYKFYETAYYLLCNTIFTYLL